MRLFFACAASVAALSGPAAAEAYNATALDIDDAAAVLTVIAEDRGDIDVQISNNGRLPTPSVRLQGDTLVIDGALHDRFRGCTSTLGGSDRVRIAGLGGVAREELPRITVHMPRRLNLEVGGAVYSSIGASGGGTVSLSGCGDAILGAVGGDLDLMLNGSGNVRASGVSGALVAGVNGSGSMRVDYARGDTVLRVNGSGDLVIGDISGALDARLAGSGELETGDVAAGAALMLNGSGEIEVGAVSGALTARLTGSGAVRADSVQGSLADLQLTSSGDLVVRNGRVDRLVARASGSGNVSFGGVAGVSDLSVQGSGDVRVADAGRVERMIDSGSGDIRVGN